MVFRQESIFLHKNNKCNVCHILWDNTFFWCSDRIYLQLAFFMPCAWIHLILFQLPDTLLQYSTSMHFLCTGEIHLAMSVCMAPWYFPRIHFCLSVTGELCLSNQKYFLCSRSSLEKLYLSFFFKLRRWKNQSSLTKHSVCGRKYALSCELVEPFPF